MKRLYEYPLIDWIGVALNTESLNTVLKTVKEEKALDDFIKPKPENRRYIEKILKEEIHNQFFDYKRPMLEVVLNSIDAKPYDYKGSYNINVKVKRKGFCSSDSGRGMSLEEILKFLIIPFNTEKKGVKEIGRFGVGFLSTFNYCLAEPDRVHLIVNTKNGEEGYIVDFYAKGHEITDLMMSVSNTGKRPSSTKVEIKRKINKRSVIEYLNDHLKNVPSYVSNIIVNKSCINDDSKFKWYVQPVSLKVLGREVHQKVGFRASGAGWHSMIDLASQGVLVKRFRNDYESIDSTVSFPPAVQVVEGRDEFKVDDNYNICVNAVFKAFEEFLKDKENAVFKTFKGPLTDQEKNEKFISCNTHLIPSLMSALGVTDSSKINNMDSIREILFPGRKYVLTSQGMINLKPFFKKVIEDYAFEVQSYQAYAYWKGFYKDEREMLEDILKPVQAFTTQDFISKVDKNKAFYPNLHLISSLLKQQDKCKNVYLVKLSLGDNCFFLDNNGTNFPLYINTNHPCVQGSLNHSKVYSLISDYFSSLKEAKHIHNIKKLDELEDYVHIYNKFLNGLKDEK